MYFPLTGADPAFSLWDLSDLLRLRRQKFHSGSKYSSGSRKRDPRMTCSDFIASPVPCACLKIDTQLQKLEGEEIMSTMGQLRHRFDLWRNPEIMSTMWQSQKFGWEEIKLVLLWNWISKEQLFASQRIFTLFVLLHISFSREKMKALISMVGSICNTIAGIVAENAVDPIAQQLSYLFKHETKFQNLRNKIEQLRGAGERVEQYVREAKRKREEIFPDVEQWLTEVNGKISDEAATQLDEDERKSKRMCFAGCFPDFKSRYQLSKEVEKEVDGIAQLLDRKERFDRVSYRPSIQAFGINRSVKEYEAFESRSNVFNGVMVALEDNAVNIIGVYGMGGVGKTTLVKEAARQAKESQLFHEVVFVAITQTPNMVKIQNEIVEKLDLKIEETSMDVKAAGIRESLKTKKNALIILDDIWDYLNLEALGVPTAGEHKGCKILMTSRRLDVLESMNSQKNLTIESLKDNEAWDLFQNMAGNIVGRPDLQSTAVEIAKRCAGLPIAIATIAKALKYKHNLFEWRDALRQLGKPSKGNFKGIPAEAYSAILSYKFLEVEELRPIFLLCSIMGHDAAIEDLLRYARGLGLFRNLSRMEETRDRVLTLVNHLKDSCLLLNGSHPTSFDMHDVVHDVAISIASRDHGWLVLTKEDVFEEWSEEETMTKCELVSLRYAKFSELPQELQHPVPTFFPLNGTVETPNNIAKVSELPNELECPVLNFVSVHGTVEITDNFLKGMQRLKVLDFAKTHFTSLPSSIGFLKILSALHLNDCVLEDIVILGELKNLEILDLRRSRVAMIPKEIGQLIRLKLLDLSGCTNLKVISPNVLSSLSRLEELYLYCSFDGWEVEGNENPRCNASLVELQYLFHLTTLEVHIRDVQAIPKDDMFFGKLERYMIIINQKWYEWYNDGWMETSRMLKFKMTSSINLCNGIKLLLKKTESLLLDEVEDVGKMLYDPITEGFPDLKYLRISNVLDIRVVLNSMMLVPCLESLSLYNLPDLEAIGDRQHKVRSFDRLRIIKVERCNTLKNLFSFSIASKFCQLEEISVSDCHNMTWLIIEEEETNENENLEFRQLRSLKLTSLASFNGLWYSEKTLESVTWIFDKKVSCPVLEELWLFQMSGIEKIWKGDQLSVQSLTSLTVYECNKLKYVFTSSMVKNFVQLKTLLVSWCNEMEDIIEGILDGEKEEESISSCISLFPKLDSLELGQLPKLERFCSGVNIPIELPSLRELKTWNCPVLRTLNCNSTNIDRKRSGNISLEQSQHLFNAKVNLPELEKLDIQNMDNLERLWHSQLAEHSFSKVTSIVLRDCPKLLNIFPLNMLTRLQRLNHLSIWDCKSLEEIIFESQPQEGSSRSSSRAMQSFSLQLIQSDVAFEFPRLTSLTLDALPNLRSIHRKMLTINLPSLKEMEVKGCNKVEILFSSQETSGMSCQQQPLFWVNQFTFPKLHQLTLGWNAGMEEIWHCVGQQLVSHYFPNLKVVKLEYYTEQILPLPSYLLPLLSSPNLQTLEIGKLFQKMIFLSEEGGEEKYPWVRKINLVPSLASFRNLATLKVERCHGIAKVITHATSKSLVQLKEMNISICNNIEEILEGGDDDDDDEISFPQLNSLKLEFLPKLENFCSSRNYTFGFPSLQTVVVHDCPMMKMFSRGRSNTPMLHKVKVNEWRNEECWEGSLNSTIQQLYREKNGKAEAYENSEDQNNGMIVESNFSDEQSNP